MDWYFTYLTYFSVWNFSYFDFDRGRVAIGKMKIDLFEWADDWPWLRRLKMILIGRRINYRSAQGPHSGCAKARKLALCSPKSPIAPIAGSRISKISMRGWSREISKISARRGSHAGKSILVEMGWFWPPSERPDFDREPLKSPMSGGFEDRFLTKYEPGISGSFGANNGKSESKRSSDFR